MAEARGTLWVSLVLSLLLLGLGCSDDDTPPPAQDCVVGDWSEWSVCSAECDGGEQTRTRPILTEPSGDGAACEATEEVQACNQDVCAPPAQDCVVGDWSEWSVCSAECDGGEQTRTRPILTEPSGDGAACEATEELQACNQDPCLRINHMQVRGTHNSYKIQPSDSLQAGINAFAPADLDPRGLVHSHATLEEQLGVQRIRQFEFDVWLDPNGGLFSEPFGPALIDFMHQAYAGTPLDFGPAGEDFDPLGEMDLPGPKVFHVQGIDHRSRCLTLAACLESIRAWSAATPSHLPIAILIELKSDTYDPEILAPLYPYLVGSPDPEPAFTIPFPWELEEGQDYSDSALQALEDQIRAAFSDRQLITPDMVRGDYDTMMDAITNEGWPKLADSMGRVMLLLDNGGALQASYVAEYPGLRGALFFVSADPGSPEAAYFQANDPFRTNPTIQELVSLGFMVRSRADAENVEADANDTTRRDQALASGATWVSTDYPVPADSGYVVTLPGVSETSPARCNPVSAPTPCSESDWQEQP
ncbi:MAG: Ca2+-dependent phosphoinositide-specific phospholipase C [Myxococcota bacterium]|nr:Ca2+-dependent phosphoinositide-specific phospholipase C [Myxococcota bacterium]